MMNDPLEVDITDPTARHYGKLTKLNIKVDSLSDETSRLQHYINAYRRYGHYFANIDPLSKINREQVFVNPKDFELELNTHIQEHIDHDSSHIGSQTIDVEDLERKLKEIYVGSVGIEFDHIVSLKEKNWLYKNFEKYQLKPLTEAEKRNIHTILTQTEAVDHYLHKKFNTFKRYAGEGVETSVSGLKVLLAKASELGVQECVIGMPHRGRLNVLSNIFEYPPEHLFRKIKGFSDMPQEYYTGQDDVISHIALSKTKRFIGTGCKEQPITVSLMHNPSHLELIGASSLGKTRAKQDAYEDKSKVLNVQFHGDAAFCAQGVVYESFAIAGVPKYTVGGSVHIIVNNQIGYTTSVKDSRAHFYCSDIGKMYQTPIIHVNADDPEAIHRVMQFAVEYRQTFQNDIIIDLIGYRKYGHNELDEPEFTQPLYYQHIRKLQKSIPTLYNEKLVDELVISDEVFQKQRNMVFQHLDGIFENMSVTNGRPLEEYKDEKSKGQTAFTKKWESMEFSSMVKDSDPITGLDTSKLIEIAKKTTQVPGDFNIHPRLNKFFLEDRIKQIDNNMIDWATAEAAAIGSLLLESYNVRLSGEDVERGTFSQRHWVLVDQKNEQEWNPLKEHSESQNKGKLYVCNSPLSESGVLSYEYGYSLEDPKNLTMWEAQFGDFFNCATTSFDNLIFGSEEKWARQTGIVVILPHGYDGAGPEHSSCKIERFLQIGNTDGINRNWKLKEHDHSRKATQIGDNTFYANAKDTNFSLVQPTTPASYFHALRRQMLRKYRKPLIVAGPKTLLRLPECRSSFEELGEGTQFQPVLSRQNVNSDTKHILLCSGKICYSLMKTIENRPDIALLVVEELLPFPEQILKDHISKAKNAKVTWVQEESTNQGAFLYAEPHINRILRELEFENQDLYYIGRRSIGSLATGVPSLHKRENELIQEEVRKLE